MIEYKEEILCLLWAASRGAEKVSAEYATPEKISYAARASYINKFKGTDKLKGNLEQAFVYGFWCGCQYGFLNVRDGVVTASEKGLTFLAEAK